MTDWSTERVNSLINYLSRSSAFTIHQVFNNSLSKEAINGYRSDAITKVYGIAWRILSIRDE